MDGTLLGWLAFGIVAGSIALWFRRIRRVDIPDDRRGFVACWIGGAGLGIFALTAEPGILAGAAATLASLAGLIFSALVYVSPQKVAENAIQVGERLRDFTALDEHEATFALASTAGKPVLVKFFRGHW